MAVGKWNVPAGTKKKLKIARKDWKVEGGAIEHKNRPEAVYILISSWVKPKLQLTKAKANSTSDPSELATIVALDWGKEVERVKQRTFKSCFDSTYFDPNSIISIIDYSPGQAQVGKRQFVEIEINIDTVNFVNYDVNEPGPNPANGKVEMYSFKDFEKPLADAVNKILSLEPFDERKALVTFSVAKGAK